MKKTAVMLSIERKENRLVKLREMFNQTKESNEMKRNILFITIETLEMEIQDDIKLRDTTEREQIEEAYNQGAIDMEQFHSGITEGKDYYQNTYGNGE
jgi:SMC interacting uncharacterized protein involved in chromosome segregation